MAGQLLGQLLCVLYQLQMKLKEEKERQEKEEGIKERDVLMEKDRIHLEMEDKIKHGQDEANKEVRKIQLQQMVNRKAVSCQPLQKEACI